MFLPKAYCIVGYVCEQHNNPADFFLDVICKNESLVTSGKYIYSTFVVDIYQSTVTNYKIEIPHLLDLMPHL